MTKGILAVVLCWVAMGSRNSASSQTTVCLTAADTTASLIAAVNRIMTPTNKVRLHANIPVTPPSEIALITNDSICTRAHDALNAYTFSGNPAPPSPLPEFPVYVLKVGTYFAVFDPEERAGEWHIMDFFDSSWNRVGGMLLPF